MPSIRIANKTPSAKADFDNSTVEISYHIMATESSVDAMALLMSTAPASQALDGVTLSHREFSLEPVAHEVWTGNVSYKKRSKELPELQANESSYSFETGGGTIHISNSLETIQTVADGAPKNMWQAIGWDGSAINGCDIQSPVFNFSETHIIPTADVDGAYKLALFAATGRVNNGTFKGFAAGEVLFLGARGSKRGDDDWEISYNFAASPNATGLSVGTLTGINKKGWEYLWLYFKDDESGDFLTKKPYQANVERVYELADFSTIGIGTT